jgi:hypothetical protein
MKSSHPVEYERYKNWPGGVPFGLFDGGAPRAFMINAIAKGYSLILTPTSTELNIKEGSDKAMAVNGETRHISTFLEAHPTHIKDNTATDIIDTLIGVEIENDPESVGPPIDILRLTEDGPSWIRRKEQCFEF